MPRQTGIVSDGNWVSCKQKASGLKTTANHCKVLSESKAIPLKDSTFHFLRWKNGNISRFFYTGSLPSVISIIHLNCPYGNTVQLFSKTTLELKLTLLTPICDFIKITSEVAGFKELPSFVNFSTALCESGSQFLFYPFKGCDSAQSADTLQRKLQCRPVFFQ